jgi:hypothetical protein
MMVLATAWLVAAATGVSFDTTVAVRPGTRLEVNNFGGGIHVTGWARNVVRIAATHGGRTRIAVDSAPAALAVRSVGRYGVPSAVLYDIVVPHWMDVKLSGVTTEMRMEGLQGDIEAATVKGGIALTGGRGFVHLNAVQGGVEVTGARGRLEVSSVNDGVHIVDVTGDVTAETVNGDIVMERIASGAVEGETVNGDVRYDGAVRRQGRYRFATHNGDVLVVLPRDAGANVSVATFRGEFESTFPVQVAEARRGRQFNFVLGDGGADLDLESFQGTVRLLRQGEHRGQEKLEKVAKIKFKKEDE